MTKQTYNFTHKGEQYWFKYDRGNAIACLEVLKKTNSYDPVRALLKSGFEEFVFEVSLADKRIRQVIFSNVIAMNEKSENLSLEILNEISNTDLAVLFSTFINAVMMNDNTSQEETKETFPSKAKAKETKN